MTREHSAERAARERDRLEELAVARATEGLDAADRLELERLAERHPEVDPEGIERAAAVVDLALAEALGGRGGAGLAGAVEPMPEALRDALAARLEALVDTDRDDTDRDDADRETADAAAPPPGEHPGAPVTRLEPRPSPRRRTGRPVAWLGWAAAAVLAVLLFLPLFEGTNLQGPTVRSPEDAGDRTAGTEGAVATADAEGAEADVDALLATAPDVVVLPWSSTEHPLADGARGSVVWSPERGEGYLRFAGLPANDPTEAQYQLWIFDAARDERYPVDGGVFDIPAGAADGEVVVPIEAKLPVAEATLFAVTLEPPGGVVVSDRDPLLLLAQPG